MYAVWKATSLTITNGVYGWENTTGSAISFTFTINSTSPVDQYCNSYLQIAHLQSNGYDYMNDAYYTIRPYEGLKTYTVSVPANGYIQILVESNATAVVSGSIVQYLYPGYALK